MRHLRIRACAPNSYAKVENTRENRSLIAAGKWIKYFRFIVTAFPVALPLFAWKAEPLHYSKFTMNALSATAIMKFSPRGKILNNFELVKHSKCSLSWLWVFPSKLKSFALESYFFILNETNSICHRNSATSAGSENVYLKIHYYVIIY